MKTLIITFENTADAISFGRTAEGLHMSGRLGPVPRALQVSCGLAWRAPVEADGELRSLIRDLGLRVKDVIMWEAAS